MTEPKQVSFDRYLDIIFASPNWLEACVNMLTALVQSIDSCRDDPDRCLPGIAPPIVDQVAAVAGAAHNLELRFRKTAEQRGPEFQTDELGAVLWWAGMASHKAASSVEAARRSMAQAAWEGAFFEIHALMYDTISALSLLAVAEGMMQRMESEPRNRERPN